MYESSRSMSKECSPCHGPGVNFGFFMSVTPVSHDSYAATQCGDGMLVIALSNVKYRKIVSLPKTCPSGQHRSRFLAELVATDFASGS